jgi:hypothetical protein
MSLSWSVVAVGLARQCGCAGAGAGAAQDMAGRGRGAVLVLVLMLLARAVATRQMLVDAGRACPAKPLSLAPLLLYTLHSTTTS